MAFSERSDFRRTGQEGFAVGISADGDEGHQTQTWRLAAEPLPASLFHSGRPRGVKPRFWAGLCVEVIPAPRVGLFARRASMLESNTNCDHGGAEFAGLR